MMDSTTVEIDGAAGEGGGQILRTALALSMVTQRGLVMHRIRAGRSRPGLMRQHLACVQAAMAVGGSAVRGAEPGSQDLAFTPAPLRSGDHAFRIGTAGSCTLVLQTVLPALLLAEGPSTVTVSGGTHNPQAPPFHFLARSFAPLVRRLGAGIALELVRMGFYPAGGGEVRLRVQPPAAGLQPIDITERGAPVEAYAECLAPALPPHVAARELDAVGRALGWERGQLRVAAARAEEGPGNALMITLDYGHVTEVVTTFGEKGISAERVAATAVRQVRAYRSAQGALGPHLADQWMLPLALAVVRAGRAATFTCTALTGHARTNMQTIAAFLPVRFETQTVEGGFTVCVGPAASS